MPIIYLSPSTQEFNFYVNGGTEEYYMNLLADKMVPYLDASGIRYSRNTPDMTAASSIAASNAGNYDLHLALHSNAAAGAQAGKARGSIAFYYPTSAGGRHAAELIADGLKTIYPDPNLVTIQATTTLGEVARVRAPAVLLELAFHDNPEDAAWIKENLDAVARILVLALTEFFDIPFFERENCRIVLRKGGRAFGNARHLVFNLQLRNTLHQIAVFGHTTGQSHILVRHKGFRPQRTFIESSRPILQIRNLVIEILRICVRTKQSRLVS